MYHFIFKITKRVFPNAFDDTRNVDPKKEQIINFCPKCNENLEDKRIITLRIHNQKKHPKTEKEMIKRFYTRGAMPMFMLMTVVTVSVIIFFGSINITNQMWEEGLTDEEKQYRNFCKELIENEPDPPQFWEDRTQYLKDRGDYILENLDSYDKCYYAVYYVSLGDREQKLEHFHSLDQEK